MSQKYRLINEIKEIQNSRLEDLFNNSETSNIFHTIDVFKFWESVPLYEPFVFAVENNENELLVILSGVIMKEGKGIKSFFTKRAIVFGGPVIRNSEQSKEALEVLLPHVKSKLSGKAIFTEIRNFNDYSAYIDVFNAFGWNYNEHLNFHLDCTDEASAKKSMSKSKLRQIKKSISTGAQIIEAKSEQHVIDFYNILSHLYKTKVKTPLPPFEFFMAFFNQNIGKYLLIEYNGEILGGIMCPILPEKVIYEWFVCGKDGKHKGIFPSVLATWAAIEYGNKNNIPYFDFMGAGRPNEDYGVREFKSKFGGNLVQHGRFVKVYNHFLYKIGALGVKFLRKVTVLGF